MMLRTRKWQAGLLTGHVARRGALVLDYRRGRRGAQVWRAGHGSSAWMVQLIDRRHRVLTAHLWQEARCHVLRGKDGAGSRA